MAEVAEHDVDEVDEDRRLGTAVGKGIIASLPVAIVLLTAAVWLITGRSIGQSLETAILPGVLLGVFFGGFIGTVRSMH